jgi:hypothetical protein
MRSLHSFGSHPDGLAGLSWCQSLISLLTTVTLHSCTSAVVRVGVNSRQDHGHSEAARDRAEGVEEDPELENIEPFSEGNDVT